MTTAAGMTAVELSEGAPRRVPRPRVTLKPYLWLLPAYALLAFVIGYPVLANIYASFTETVAGEPEFVGLQQYISLFEDPEFVTSILKTIVWTVGVTALQFVGGAAVAVAADRNSFFVRRIRSILIIPWVLPGVVAANIWVYFYTDRGLVNQVLGLIGIHTSNAWLANPKTAFLAVIIAAGWKGFPFYFLLLLAGLQSVPAETREAAQIDGAGRFQTLVRVVLPQMRAVILTSLVLGVIATSNYFDGIYLMTGGGPTAATQTLPVWVYNVAFSQFELAKASALSVIILLLALIPAVTWLIVRGRKARAS